MMTVNITFTGDLEDFISNRLKKGYATSKAEVLRQCVIERLEKDRAIQSKEDLNISTFSASNSNKKIWADEKENKVWDKY